MNLVKRILSSFFIESSGQSCTQLPSQQGWTETKNDQGVWKSDFLPDTLKLVHVDNGHRRQPSGSRRLHQVMDCSQIEGSKYLCGKLVPAVRPKQAWGTVNRSRRAMREASTPEKSTDSDLYDAIRNPGSSINDYQTAPDESLLLGNCMQHKDEKGISYLNYDFGYLHSIAEYNGNMAPCLGPSEQQFECNHASYNPERNYGQHNSLHELSEPQNGLRYLPSIGMAVDNYPRVVCEMDSHTDPFEKKVYSKQDSPSLHQIASREQNFIQTQNSPRAVHPYKTAIRLHSCITNNGLIHHTTGENEQSPMNWEQESMYLEPQAAQATCTVACANSSQGKEGSESERVLHDGVAAPLYLDPPVHFPIQHEKPSQTPQMMKSASTQTGYQAERLIDPVRNYEESMAAKVTGVDKKSLENTLDFPNNWGEASYKTSNAAILCNKAAPHCNQPLRSPRTFNPHVKSVQKPVRPSGIHNNRHAKATVDQVTYFEPVQPQAKRAAEIKPAPVDPLKSEDPPTLDYCGPEWCSLALIYTHSWNCEGYAYGELDISRITCGPCIGRGASSQVHKGLYESVGVPTIVALKFLVKGARGQDVRKEFRRESQILVKVPEHDNVVKMIGVVGACMVLEYCNKGSLYSMLHDPGCQITWEKVWELALAIARGMDHLHHYRIIHRDLKPGNIMVHEDHNGSTVVKIADFGLSRNFLMNSPMTAGVGTWQYSAPEVLCEDKYSQKADVYSYGMVIWETCTRSEPYQGQPPAKAFQDINAGILPHVPSSLPPAVQQLLSHCLALNPEERSSFKDIVSLIEQLQPSLQEIKDEAILIP